MCWQLNLFCFNKENNVNLDVDSNVRGRELWWSQTLRPFNFSLLQLHRDHQLWSNFGWASPFPPVFSRALNPARLPVLNAEERLWYKSLYRVVCEGSQEDFQRLLGDLTEISARLNCDDRETHLGAARGWAHAVRIKQIISGNVKLGETGV